MKAKASALFTIAALVLFLSGCATSKIDWDARRGNYTYDLAILELGPPDKSAKIGDGTIVAEWLTYRGSRGSDGFYISPHYYEPPVADRFLRLTFDPEGRLRDWRKVAR